MITKKDVTYIADLARLELNDQEIESFTGQLGAILDHVADLNKVDTTGIEPTCFVVPDHDPLRDDVVKPSLPTDELLKNGPKVEGQFFAVPKVIG
jgi:aspartyl-tRNA(Asn)/glutamyl-tRNA(Gln) amidotransferase subunit C